MILRGKARKMLGKMKVWAESCRTREERAKKFRMENLRSFKKKMLIEMGKYAKAEIRDREMNFSALGFKNAWLEKKLILALKKNVQVQRRKKL